MTGCFALVNRDDPNPGDRRDGQTGQRGRKAATGKRRAKDRAVREPTGCPPGWFTSTATYHLGLLLLQQPSTATNGQVPQDAAKGAVIIIN